MVVIGIAFTSSINLVYNFIIMPLIGMVAYLRGMKRWYLTPVLVLIITYLWLLISYGIEAKEFSVELFGYPIFFSLIYTGLTALGLVVGTLIKLLFQKDTKNLLKVLGGLGAFSILGFLLFIVNSFVGNPISSMHATYEIKSYVKDTYPDLNLKVESAVYNFKNSEYASRVNSEDSIDTTFRVAWRKGRIIDGFDYEVTSRYSTFIRIQNEFNKAVEEIIEKEFPYQTSILFADLYKEDFSDLELDMTLNIQEPPLPATLTVYILSNEISYEVLRDRLLELYRIMTKHKIPIELYNVVIEETTEDGKDRIPGGESIHLFDFPTEYIDEPDLIGIIKEHQDKMYQEEKSKNKY